MKKGFYHLKNEDFERCYYLTGEKKGNKWIDIKSLGESLVETHDFGWWALNWMCLPDEEEHKKLVYSKENPTNFKLKIS